MLADRLNLKGKYAAILGGAGGIGRAVTLALADEGVNIAMCDKNPDYLVETKKDVEAKGVKCLAIEVNVLSKEAVDAFFDMVAEGFPHIDILINLAGGVRNRDFLTGSDQDDADDIRRNYGYVIQSIKRGVPLIERSGKGGCIVNFTTIESRRGAAGYSVYAGAKAATMNLTRALAVELASKKIRVNEIIPDTTWSEGNMNAMSEERRARLTNAPQKVMKHAFETYVPLGAAPLPEDQADAVVFLVSDAARMLTGVGIPVDGGTGAAMGFLRWPYDEGFGPAPSGKAAALMYSELDD